MESSQFSDTHCKDVGFELIESNSASCDTFRVKLYGKLHFLKRLKPEYVDDIRYQEAFRKEFETGYNLEHPNLVHYVSYSDDGILMEYIDGETLTHFLSSHPDYFKNKKNIGKFLGQLLDVVGYLHSHQVLHLDLKPDNIMLTRIDNTVKLIDLGCCYTDTFTDTQGLTNHYAAPEQLAGNSTDARTDIYAIGKILEFLPSHHIYHKVVALCTASNKTERYQTIEQLRHALNKSPMRHFIIWMLSSLLVVGVVSLIWYHGRFQFKSVEAMKDNAPKYETIKTDTQKKDSVNIPFVAQSPMKMIGDVIVQDQGQPNTESKSQSTPLNDLDEEQRFWKAIDSIQKKNAYKSHPFPSDSVLLAPYYRKLGMKAMNLDHIPLTIGQGRWTIPTYMISRKEAIQ
ncbi:MAG: serine/threonine protein kinase, partial [Prevotella sp.]|nr:serine/threonine protein kinase [Prevotella sp.]